MQIIPFRIFLSWSIVIIFLKPILRIFEFYRILYPMYKFQIFQRPKLPSLFVYETIPRFEIDFPFRSDHLVYHLESQTTTSKSIIPN